jgi:hypothetical protein
MVPERLGEGALGRILGIFASVAVGRKPRSSNHRF